MPEKVSHLTGIQFDSNYDGDALFSPDSPLREICGDIIPWDIGGPQPALVEIEQAGGFRGEVLDLGCGLGENARFLAGRGHRVTAVDASPNAIRLAVERTAPLGLDVQFVVSDAITLEGLDADARFDTVIDSALYHGLDPEERKRYLATLHRVSTPGATLHVICFSDLLPKEIAAPNRCSAEDVRSTFAGAGWAINKLEQTTYTVSTRFDRDILYQIVDVLNVPGGREFVGGLPADEQNRLLLPVWAVTADRA
ncbi:class I SAM-dependent methyltransferase [Streptomyces sp. NBC_01387]|uniref:class I SAM-dependent methyltransferase n=1 Tax=unclassified Streptomyces TaxID=2593676 RepID=UPI002025943C|nr:MULTISPECIES: class I SAM-dependent methyltransferase [unclassified Streptomyces]WSC23876.1 class I SAM-dependent methyltransferase [Streptomyces sp. NBC_01766]WSV57745.1 class I SAM-dependent methyltransferase [Streptomyces sp. NBC_01014]